MPASTVNRLHPFFAILMLTALLQPLTARLSTAQAQSQAAAPPASVSPSERREQLAKISEGLNSPDPLRRMATLDSVLHDNDMLARQLATQVALDSSDTTMRQYAALLILSKTQIMNLALAFPAEVQAKLDKSSNDDEARSKVSNGYTNLFRFLGGGGQHVVFQMSDLDLNTGQFKVTCQGDPKASPTSVGQINGGSLEFRAHCVFPGTIETECGAALQLGSQGVFTGTLSCVNVPLPMPATLRLH